MKKIIAALSHSFAALSLISACVYADHERGFFAGGSIAYTSADTGLSGSESEVNHGGFELVGGYKFNGWLGVDARYGAGLSDKSLTTEANADSPQGGRITYDIGSYQSFYYRPEITNKEAKLYFLIGYSTLDTSNQVFRTAEDGSETLDATIDTSESGTSYGFGAGWFVDERININVEYRKLLDDSEDDTDIITIGADYRF